MHACPLEPRVQRARALEIKVMVAAVTRTSKRGGTAKIAASLVFFFRLFGDACGVDAAAKPLGRASPFVAAREGAPRSAFATWSRARVEVMWDSAHHEKT